jgi:hypothetical protein
MGVINMPYMGNLPVDSSECPIPDRTQIEVDLLFAKRQLESMRQHNENQAESIETLTARVNELEGTRGSCPGYYLTSPIYQFVDYQKTVLVPLLVWLQYDELVIHCMLSASEHYFRKGRKTADESHDITACDWWLSEADNQWKTLTNCKVQSPIGIFVELVQPLLDKLIPDGD